MALQLPKKWGNSLAVRGAAAAMETAQFSLNQRVEVRAENAPIIIEHAPPVYSLNELLAGITLKNRHTGIDSGLPQGQELL